MQRHYKDQPLFPTARKETETPLEEHIRERNKRVDRAVPMKDNKLSYWCKCGRKAHVWVYCRVNEVFAHNCPKCGAEVILEANPKNPLKS